MITIIIIVFVLAILAGYAGLCINIIKPNEMGIRVFLGKPNEDAGVLDHGFHFAFWPFEKIVRYTKERMLFKFQTKTVVTKKGKVKGYEEMDPAELNIDCAVYASFAQSNDLFKTLEKAPGSTAREIGPTLVPYVMDTVRALCGRIPWRLINQERQDFAQWIISRLVGSPTVDKFNEVDKDEDKNIGFFSKDQVPPTSAELEKSSPFIIFGLKDVSFVILDISFADSEMQLAVSAPEKARLQKAATIAQAEAKKEATIREGEGNSKKIRLEGQASAEARDLMIKVIKEEPELEVLFTLREMAKGTSNTILYQLPRAFEDKVKEMFGGNGFEDFLKILKPEDQKKVVDYMFSLKKGGENG